MVERKGQVFVDEQAIIVQLQWGFVEPVSKILRLFSNL